MQQQLENTQMLCHDNILLSQSSLSDPSDSTLTCSESPEIRFGQTHDYRDNTFFFFFSFSFNRATQMVLSKTLSRRLINIQR